MFTSTTKQTGQCQSADDRLQKCLRLLWCSQFLAAERKKKEKNLFLWTRQIEFADLRHTRRPQRESTWGIKKAWYVKYAYLIIYNKGNSSNLLMMLKNRRHLTAWQHWIMAYSMAGQFKCDALASWVPRLVPQYVHDSVSNVSHLPAVNDLVPSYRW